ncbi:MAG: extracellular solute-binding protein [Firmicutes bacterium]|jgi:multiple sugar transport system substrate-binding protein|nr:extracellular solute-binding protein [Bacillota bacterium]
MEHIANYDEGGIKVRFSKTTSVCVFLSLVLILVLGTFVVSAEDIAVIEQKLADEAFEAADKGNPDPAWAGKRFTVATLASGPRGSISGPYYYWRPYFEKLTGATYDIVEIPFGDLQAKIFTDLATGQGVYDAIVGPLFFMGDYISNDWIIPIDKYFDDPRMPKWDRDSIAPPIHKLLHFGDHWYAFNNDHDGMVIYYRRDLLTDPTWQSAFKEEHGYDLPVPPRTWQQVLDVANFFNGKDWNGDGKTDYGISMHLKVGEQGFFNYIALAGAFVVNPASGDDPTTVTRYNNVFWFDPETMDPLINTPGHVRALEILKQLVDAGPRAMLGWGLAEAWDVFLRGDCAMVFTFGDVGTLSQDTRSSSIRGKQGVVAIPGSSEVYDLEAKQWSKMEPPNKVANESGASWSPVISKFSKNPDLVAYFCSLLATPGINHWNVLVGWTGVDPGTRYDFLPPFGKASVEDYVQTGYDAEDMTEFLSAYYELWFEYPLNIPYLRIPGTADYIESLDIHISEALSDQVSVEEALNRTARDWDRITDRLGRKEQLKLYQEAIGYTAN